MAREPGEPAREPIELRTLDDRERVGLVGRMGQQQRSGVLDERDVASFRERQRLVDKQAFDLMAARYATDMASKK